MTSVVTGDTFRCGKQLHVAHTTDYFFLLMRINLLNPYNSHVRKCGQNFQLEKNKTVQEPPVHQL